MEENRGAAPRWGRRIRTIPERVAISEMIRVVAAKPAAAISEAAATLAVAAILVAVVVISVVAATSAEEAGAISK